MSLIEPIMPPDVLEASSTILAAQDLIWETYPKMSLTLIVVLVTVDALPGISASGLLAQTGMNADAIDLACKVLGSDSPEGPGSLHLIKRDASPSANGDTGFVVTEKGSELLQRVSALVTARAESSVSAGGMSGAGAP